MPSTNDLEAAIAIFLFRKLQGALPPDYLATIILSDLAAHSSGEILLTKIATLPLLRNLTSKWKSDDNPIVDSVSYLKSAELVSTESAIVTITSGGRSRVEQLRTLRETERKQAFGQFELSMKTLNPKIDVSDLDQCVRLAETVIVTNFTERGATIANTV